MFRKKQEEGYSSIIVTLGEEIVSAYVDGEDVMDERKALGEPDHRWGFTFFHENEWKVNGIFAKM